MGHAGLEAFRADYKKDLDRANQLIIRSGGGPESMPSTIINWFININIGSLRWRAQLLAELGGTQSPYDSIYDPGIHVTLRDGWQGDGADAFQRYFTSQLGEYSLQSHVSQLKGLAADHAATADDVIDELRNRQDAVYGICRDRIAGISDRWEQLTIEAGVTGLTATGLGLLILLGPVDYAQAVINDAMALANYVLSVQWDAGLGLDGNDFSEPLSTAQLARFHDNRDDIGDGSWSTD